MLEAGSRFFHPVVMPKDFDGHINVGFHDVLGKPGEFCRIGNLGFRDEMTQLYGFYLTSRHCWISATYYETTLQFATFSTQRLPHN